MYDRLKGFRDFYPDEMTARREVIDTVESAAARYGFREIGTPTLEATDLYTDKSGDEIVEQLYNFTDKGGRDVTLTPELTPTVARMVVAKQQALAKPIKWYSTRPFWRYEQVQQGRFREFYQTNVDIFGSSEPTADAEILAFAADALTDLGLAGDDFEFRVSHRDLLGGLLNAFDADVDTEAAIRAVDKSAKIETDEYYDLLHDAGLRYDQAETFDDLLGTDDLGDLVDFAETDRVADAVANLKAVLAAADDFGPPTISAFESSVTYRWKPPAGWTIIPASSSSVSTRRVRSPDRSSAVAATTTSSRVLVVSRHPLSASRPATPPCSCSVSAPASGLRRHRRRTTTSSASATPVRSQARSPVNSALAATSSKAMCRIGASARR